MPSDAILDRSWASTSTLASRARIARGDAESFEAIRAWADEAGDRQRTLLLDALRER